MSILNKIKQGVKKSGTNKGKVIYLKADSKTRVRFLQDVDEGIEVKMHDHFDKGINVICQELVGKDCEYCEDESLRHRDAYVWSVWDYDAKEVKLFMGFANNFSPLPSLISMYEAYGTLKDRDYVLQRNGSGTNTTYGVVPMDKVKFKNTKAKPYSEQKAISILDKAFPADDSDSDDEEEEVKSKSKSKNNKKNKKARDEEEEKDDIQENNYEDMTPKELYMKCVERGIKVKKKKDDEYYIDLLLEYDLEHEDDDEDEEDEW